MRARAATQCGIVRAYAHFPQDWRFRQSMPARALAVRAARRHEFASAQWPRSHPQLAMTCSDLYASVNLCVRSLCRRNHRPKAMLRTTLQAGKAGEPSAILQSCCRISAPGTPAWVILLGCCRLLLRWGRRRGGRRDGLREVHRRPPAVFRILSSEMTGDRTRDARV